MSNIENVQSFIFQEKIFVVIRDSSYNRALKTAYILREAGINLIEVSLLTQNSFQLIETLRKDNIFVGVGTAMDSIMAKDSINSGAQFIISPHIDEEIILLARKNNVFVSSGAVTPNEIVNANRKGSDLIKVFPAHGFGGVSYLKSLIDIFPTIHFMPTGGVNEENISDYFNIGVKAVGISTSILDPVLLKKEEFGKIKDKAKKILKLINQ